LIFEALENRCVFCTTAVFDLSALDSSPSPSDKFTVEDAGQLTGLKVELPLPDRAAWPSDFDDINVINSLDGFNLQPRLSIPFSGPIDLSTVNSSTIFLVKLEDPTAPHEPGGQIVGINQTVWDAETNTLHLESDELLEQHTRYALIVTNGILDADGLPVESSDQFERFRHDLNLGQSHNAAMKEYRKYLLDALKAAPHAVVAEDEIVAASVFTTMSTTAVLEKMRDQIHAATPTAADFLLGPSGTRTMFALDQLTSITLNRETSVGGPLSPVPVSLPVLRATPGVGTIAFGKYLSPDYQVHPGEFIPPVDTRTGTPIVQQMTDVYFNLFLPTGPTPAGGWPVALFGHGSISHKNDDPLRVAATNAAHGIATMAINIAGYGFGSRSTLTVNLAAGGPITFQAGGRSIDQNSDGAITNGEGQFTTAPRTIIGDTDALRQTAADLMQLVRVIQVGMDVDGDGFRDVDPTRISYAGHSFGASLGVMVFAVEPGVHAGAFNVPSGSRVEALRLGARRAALGEVLAARVPPLINSPGISAIGGIGVAGPHFNENMPLRDGLPLSVRLSDGTNQVIQSPVVNIVAGAMELQRVFEWREWVSQTGNPVAFAPHLRKEPLPSVPVRPVLFQFDIGDPIAPNPTNAAILRTGDLADRATIYRNDLAFAENPAVPKNQHAFLLRIDSPVPLVRQVAFGAQEQMAMFLASEGALTLDPEPSRLFEELIDLALLEDLDYIP
jgi:hypothetical protein